MEILNNIWLAISTPNENLTNILVIFMGFFENFLSKFLFVLMLTSASILNMYIIPNPFNVFINYFVNVLLIFYIFKLSILKSMLATLFSSITFGLIGFLILNPYLFMLNITSDQLLVIPSYRFGYLAIMDSIAVIIVLIIKIRNVHILSLDELDKKNKYIITVNLILGIITLIIQTLMIFYYLGKLPIFLNFLSFISLFTYFGISLFSLTRVLKLTLTTRKLESAEAYNNTLRILHDNVRGFKHDFDNIVTTIGGYIRTEDMEGLKKYYLQLEDDCQRVNTLYILNPEIVNNDGIYNLLAKKYQEADSKNIKVNITFLLDLGDLHMKIYEFARILGILLDNAIEASSECEEKIINLTFRNDNKNTRELIIIENTYNDKNIDTEKIFEKGVSGKESHTGLGLWEVRKIIKKNNNVNLHTSKNDRFFSQQLEIYY